MIAGPVETLPELQLPQPAEAAVVQVDSLPLIPQFPDNLFSSPRASVEAVTLHLEPIVHVEPIVELSTSHLKPLTEPTVIRFSLLDLVKDGSLVTTSGHLEATPQFIEQLAVSTRLGHITVIRCEPELTEMPERARDIRNWLRGSEIVHTQLYLARGMAEWLKANHEICFAYDGCALTNKHTDLEKYRDHEHCIGVSSHCEPMLPFHRDLKAHISGSIVLLNPADVTISAWAGRSNLETTQMTFVDLGEGSDSAVHGEIQRNDTPVAVMHTPEEIVQQRIRSGYATTVEIPDFAITIFGNKVHRIEEQDKERGISRDLFNLFVERDAREVETPAGAPPAAATPLAYKRPVHTILL